MKNYFKNGLNWAKRSFLLSFIVSPIAVFSQNRTISGTVVDSSGETIIGASVLVKGTNNGVITDLDGKFVLQNVPENGNLQISFVGFKTQVVSIDGMSMLKIILKEDTKILDEVVVVGYGVQRKADLTGSVANIDANELNTQSNVSIGQALQGKIAGVDIVSQGGTPGAGTRVMVRGIGTLNNSAPLYIVDGMYMSSIDHINPSDIASIDVLKDASSAAIYGSRAANGVIIITTKEGTNTEGEPIIELSTNVGISVPSKYLDLLNAQQWADVTTKSREAVGLPPLDMALDLENKEDNDWQDIMLNPAILQNYNVSIKGGGKYSTYYNSIGYTNQDGVMKGTDFSRYTLQSKFDTKKGIFQLGTNVLFTYDQSSPLLSENRGGMVGHTIRAVPTLSKYDSENAGGYGATYGDALNLYHPLGMVDDNLMKRYRDNTRVYINGFFSIEPIKGLKYKLSVTPDFHFYRNNTYQGIYNYGLSHSTKTDVKEAQTRDCNILIENLLTFDKSFNKNKISLLAGYSYQDSRYRSLSGGGQEMPNGIYEISAAKSGISAKGSSSRSVLTSVLARAFYSYDNRYLATISIRRDGSSKFARNNRYGNFPSISLGWNIAEEKWIKNNVSWLEQLKLRGGYGVLGNQEIDDYQYSAIVSSGINYPSGDGKILTGSFPKNFANPNIRWEETAMTNIGIDFLALNNRLNIIADWYVKNTKDILLNVPIPISTGSANDPVRNAGRIQNKGFEFNIGWNEYLSNEFSYGFNFIGTYNKNEVINMGSDSQSITGGTITGGTYTTRTLAGYPIGGFWLIPCDGYFNSIDEVNSYQKNGKLIQPSAEPGDIRFKDMNGDGTINDGDRVYCGSPFPNFTFSINGNITYKNFDLAVTFQGVLGNKIYNATRQQLEDVTLGANYSTSVLDYWTPENHNASVPRLVWNDPNRNARTESDRFLENGSYFRMRTFQMGYNLPKNIFKGFVKQARIYFSVDNLFTITSYSGYSPDVNTSNVYSRGLDDFIYPNTRTFMLGMNLTF